MSKSPRMIEMDQEKAIKQVANLAKAYTPEWHFREEKPDVGSVVALIYADLLRQSTEVVNHSLLRHHIGLINCLEVEAKVAQPAQSYVSFEVMPTLDTGVMIKKGTKLIGHNEEGEEITFVTAQGIFASKVAPTSIYATSKWRDYISKVYGMGQAIEALSLPLFTPKSDNLQTHALYMMHPYILEGTAEGELILEVGVSVAQSLMQLEWYLRSEGGWLPITSRLDNTRLIFNITMPQREVFRNEEGYWLAAFAKGELPDITLQSIGLSLSKNQMTPETICVQDIACLEETFLPFGENLQIYQECYIRCDEGFAKKGAKIQLSFELDYKVKEEREYEVPIAPKYKLIMRKPSERTEEIPVEVYADQVVWEYWSDLGWARIPLEATWNSVFNGKTQGQQNIIFECPEDMAIGTVQAYKGRWIRVRLIQVANNYYLPRKEYLPKMSQVRLAYWYDKPFLPKSVSIQNNTKVQEITSLLLEGRKITVFEPLPFEGESLLIGFDELPIASPMSLFFDIERRGELTLSGLIFEYSTLKNEDVIFKLLKVADGTKNLNETGNMMWMIPNDFEKGIVFGEEKYWFKISHPSDTYSQLSTIMPVIKGIYKNTVRVINEIKKEAYFYITETIGSQDIKLEAERIIDIEVWLNECPVSKEQAEAILEEKHYSAYAQKDKVGNISSLWVRWHRVEHLSDLQPAMRCYYFDSFKKEIIFPDNVFVQIPIKLGYEAVHVVYKCCDGTRGNVKSGSIDTLGQTVSFVSRVYNPVDTFGSSDFESVEDTLKRMAKYLGHREQLVTQKDYEEVVKGYSSAIAKVKCLPQMNGQGEVDSTRMTLVVLLKEFEKGEHAFSSYKEGLRTYVLSKSNLQMQGYGLDLREPLFIKLSVKVWITVSNMEKAYDYQEIIDESIKRFIHPITGYFDGKGWAIGTLPQRRQIGAYLKSLRLGCILSKMILMGQIFKEGRWVQKELSDLEGLPYVMAINGTHDIIIECSDLAPILLKREEEDGSFITAQA